MNLNKTPAALALVAMLALPGCIFVEDTPSLTIENQSSYTLVEVYMSPQGDETWGPNQLPAGDVLFPGDTLIVTGLECYLYDVQVIDNTGVSCTLAGLDPCFDDIWTVDDVFLNICAAPPSSR